VRILVIDVGGTHIKVAGSWDRVTQKIPSGPTMTAADMVQAVLTLTKTWDFEAVSLGYPGPVKENRPMREPINIAGGWTTFDFQKAFNKPVRIINDAAMQALGSYAGGRMLFLGLGTGLGTSIVDNWRVEPLEIAHLPYRKGHSYEDYLGEQGLQKLGETKWERHVHRVCDLFRAALLCDGIVLGGGNARKLVDLPDAATRGSNENAIYGGIRLWERTGESTAPEFVDARTAGEAQVTAAAPSAPAAPSPSGRKTIAKKGGSATREKRASGAKQRAGSTTAAGKAATKATGVKRRGGVKQTKATVASKRGSATRKKTAVVKRAVAKTGPTAGTVSKRTVSKRTVSKRKTVKR
jgi:polyphosphate glucokinase